MARTPSQRKAQAAWDRLMALGGHGVWDGDMVVVSLADTGVTDDDLVVFRDFPFIQTLDLSHTRISGAGLVHLAKLSALKELIVVGTKITKSALAAFQREHPTVQIVTQSPPKGMINPLTGERL